MNLCCILSSRVLRKRSVALTCVVFVFCLAVFTLFRLTKSSPDEDGRNTSESAKSTFPIELSWPFALTKEQATKNTVSAKFFKKNVAVDNTQIEKLRKTFPLIDSNGDNYVSTNELQNWIISKVKEHIQGALRENIFLFTSIDTLPRNGRVSWEEYHAWFLKKNGLNASEFLNLDEKDPKLRTLREKIAWDQAAWSETAKTEPDFLNLDEFLSSRHPESSSSSLLSKADDIIGEYDRDADETLTWEEYSSIPINSILVKYTEDKREEEFYNFIDRNRDGKLDKKEILAYVDPRNPRHSHLEAMALMQLSDANGDSQLSVDEMISSAGIFLASKVINTETNFHDEF